MGTPVVDARPIAARSDGIISHFYTSEASIDGRAEEQLKQVGSWAGVTGIAAFPDLHPGKHGPVGCAVLADRVYPQLIGNDIGCGMSLFQLDLPRRKLKLDKAVQRIRILGEATDRRNHGRLEEAGLSTDLYPEALGTIGGGNHFCEVQSLTDAAEACDLSPSATYLLVHSGSRGLGTAILGSLPRDALDGLPADAAADYVARHDQAVRWASLNRRIIAERAAQALRTEVRMVADVPHNLLAATDGGWLHRKGAAVADELVPVAGTRATPSYLVKPLANAAAMHSLAHGAGRRYDRSSMHGRVRGKKSDIAAMERNGFGGRIVCEDRDLLIEEAPSAYKSAEQVIADLEATGVATRVATLNPLLTFKKIRQERQDA